MANGCTRFAGAHETEPGRIWLGLRRADDFDNIAALYFCAQWKFFVVDFDCDALIPQFAVNRVGKIKRGCAARKRYNFCIRGKNIYRIRKQIDLDMLKELAGIARLKLDIQQ